MQLRSKVSKNSALAAAATRSKNVRKRSVLSNGGKILQRSAASLVSKPYGNGVGASASAPLQADSDGFAAAQTHETVISKLEDLYNRDCDPSKAPGMKSYMGNQFEYYGLQSTPRRKIDTEVLKLLPSKHSPADVQQFIRMCWLRPKREIQYFAQDYLVKLFKCDIQKGQRPKFAADASFLCFIEWLLSTKAWWDTVDCIASNVLGPFLFAHPELLPHMDRWIEHDDMWIRRSALLFQLKYHSRTDFARLERYILKTAHEKEFFIRKAIGWALRQYAYTDSKKVREFVSQHRDLLSDLSQREALKNIGLVIT